MRVTQPKSCFSPVSAEGGVSLGHSSVATGIFWPWIGICQGGNHRAMVLLEPLPSQHAGDVSPTQLRVGRGAQGQPGVQGWLSLPREQGCEPHQECEGQQGCIPQPRAGITGHSTSNLCCPAAIPELRKGSRGGSSLSNAGLAGIWEAWAVFAGADSHMAVLEGFSCSSRSCSCVKLISWSVNCSDRGARGDFLLLPVLQQGEAAELSQWLLQNLVLFVVMWEL